MLDNLLRIKLFVAVYEERSFTSAAVREHATQSGVTQHMQKLEDYLGVKLFVRGSGSVTPTPAGDHYYRSCIDLLRRHMQARQDMQAFERGLSGEVRVGLTPTTTRAVLAPTLLRFMQAHPNVVVRVVDAYSDIVTDKVRGGELDFAIVPAVREQPGLRAELFARTPEFLVSSRHGGHGLVYGEPVRLRDLGLIKLVLPSQAQARRAALDNYLAESGACVDRKLEIDTSLGAMDFVSGSDWMSIHPGLMLRSRVDCGEFIVNPLEDPALMLDLFRIERASEPLSEAALAFQAQLRLQAEALLSVVDPQARLRGAEPRAAVAGEAMQACDSASASA